MLKIVHIPLDERPCNYNFPKDIFHGKEFNIVRVPFEFMGLKKKPGNIDKIQDFFEKECKDAMFLMSSKIESTDPSKALILLEKCARLNDAEAYYKLGKWYGLGYIVEKDEKKAFGYYTKASNLGHYSAMCNLGIAYINGKGVS